MRAALERIFCCVYCGAPTLRFTCRAHRDLPKRDREYTPRGILYQPSKEHERRHR